MRTWPESTEAEGTAELMVSESGSEPNAYARSRATERFIARAAKIREDPVFKTKLDQARENWNRDYPAYQIKARSPNVLAQPNVEGEDLPLPPRLAQAIRPWRDGSWQRSMEGVHDLTDLEVKGRELMARHEATLRAIGDWTTRVWDLAHEGWPPKLYPNWHGRFALNPARRFVAACLIWEPVDLQPEEWIDPVPHRALIQTIPFDPTDPLAIPDVFRWRTAFDALATLMKERSLEGRPLTLEESAKLIDEAQHHGEQMGNVMSEWARNRDPEGFRFVRLHRGMNTQDWRELEPDFVQSQITAYGEAHWAEEARRLYTASKNISDVARTLGVERPTVRRWIRGED